jgi:hypothetical protein
MLEPLAPEGFASNIGPLHFLHGRINRRKDRGASSHQIASENSQRFLISLLFFSKEAVSAKEKECSMKL